MQKMGIYRLVISALVAIVMAQYLPGSYGFGKITGSGSGGWSWGSGSSSNSSSGNVSGGGISIPGISIGGQLSVGLSVKLPILGGLIQGIINATINKKFYASFTGIRYGQPPVGNLRFAPPKAVHPWTNIFLANKPGNRCPQLASDGSVIGDEDCLVLNVYTTRTLSVSGLHALPVLVFFHGGGYVTGAGSDYGVEYFLDKYDCVVVTVNYRLGALGWLRIDSSDITGNMGLKDQALALAWIQKNIVFFGGDASRVLIFGQGAGAMSVHAQYLSTYAAGMFSAVMAESGTLLSSWGIVTDYQSTAQIVISNANCNSTSPDSVASCLRSADVTSLIFSQFSFSSISMTLIQGGGFPFGPVIDGDFLSDTPENIIKSGNFQKVPFVGTVTSSEMLYFLAQVTVAETDLYSFFGSAISVLFGVTSNNQLTIVQQMLYRNYFGTTDITTLEITKVISGFIAAATDRYFVNPIRKTLQLQTTAASSVSSYLAEFSYVGSFTSIITSGISWLQGIGGVPHTGDLYYEFVMKGVDTTIATESDKTVISYMLGFIYNLAASGNPTPEPVNGFTWTTFSVNSTMAVVDTTITVVSIAASFAAQVWGIWEYYSSCICAA